MKHLTLFSLLAPLLMSSGQESHLLRLKLEPGQVVTTVSKDVIQSTDPSTTTVYPVSKTHAITIAEGTEDWDIAKIRITEGSITSEEELAQIGLNSDTHKVGMLDQKVTCEFNELGEVRRVRVDRILKNSFFSLADPTQTGLLEFVFPKEAVSVGSKWNQEVDWGKVLDASDQPEIFNSKGNVLISYSILEFTEHKGQRVAKIASKVFGKLTYDIKGSELGGVIEYTATGTALVSIENGIPLESKTISTFIMNSGGLPFKNVSTTTEISTVK